MLYVFAAPGLAAADLTPTWGTTRAWSLSAAGRDGTEIPAGACSTRERSGAIIVTISAMSAEEAEMEIAARRVLVGAKCTATERDAPIRSGARVT
jgi:hypothetical protein